MGGRGTEGNSLEKARLILGDPTGEAGMGWVFSEIVCLSHCVLCFRDIKLGKTGVRCCWSSW